MSDLPPDPPSDLPSDDELPAWLIDAILDEQPAQQDIDLVKEAFTWRTIDAELMQIAYDSLLDEAGIRDANAARTLEFTVGALSLVIEVDGRAVRGSLSGRIDAMVVRYGASSNMHEVPVTDQSFAIEAPTPGAMTLRVLTDDGWHETPTVAIG